MADLFAKTFVGALAPSLFQTEPELIDTAALKTAVLVDTTWSTDPCPSWEVNRPLLRWLCKQLSPHKLRELLSMLTPHLSRSYQEALLDQLPPSPECLEHLTKSDAFFNLSGKAQLLRTLDLPEEVLDLIVTYAQVETCVIRFPLRFPLRDACPLAFELPTGAAAALLQITTRIPLLPSTTFAQLVRCPCNAHGDKALSLRQVFKFRSLGPAQNALSRSDLKEYSATPWEAARIKTLVTCFLESFEKQYVQEFPLYATSPDPLLALLSLAKQGVPHIQTPWQPALRRTSQLAVPRAIPTTAVTSCSDFEIVSRMRLVGELGAFADELEAVLGAVARFPLPLCTWVLTYSLPDALLGRFPVPSPQSPICAATVAMPLEAWWAEFRAALSCTNPSQNWRRCPNLGCNHHGDVSSLAFLQMCSFSGVPSKAGRAYWLHDGEFHSTYLLHRFPQEGCVRMGGFN